MPPRKSDRVRAIEDRVGRPLYSDTARRASSVGAAPARSNARRSSVRSATTEHDGRGRETDDVPPQQQLLQLEESLRIKSEQHEGYRDLSVLVEELSQLVTLLLGEEEV
ncbi:uncharacterized protein MELLADRAFT_102971 [Melampsora larici-populina 98AG31]|uniref:Uncharacterized protein n=1 Tax=Melampsora larici-populina (strain 98AG31 / pathotype 3-4-7) TaxID=747676 RepID=F4RA44_MELLP|nr:uncharacterized protein MELLADRAFT_102971 [Melampsora larici-populina 98AG31]EGG10848.1 hypothetical protein MELLADRAFT_102971 [Melampsora larici-populina 98AG31]